MSNITKPIILDETGVAIKEAIQGLQPDSACVVTINGASISLKQWITNCEAGVYDSTYLGVKATITNLLDKKTFRVRLIGINHDVIASTDEGGLEPSGEKAKTTWQFYDMPMKKVPLGLPFDYKVYVDEGEQDQYPSNKGGYPTATALLDVLNVIFGGLPLELQRAIKTVRKDCFIPKTSITDDYGDIEEYSTASWIQYEGDRYGGQMYQKLFHLSAAEVGIIHNPQGTKDPFPLTCEDGEGNPVNLEGTKYEYFNETYAYTSEPQNDRRRPCEYGGNLYYYWLRSPDLDLSGYGGYVSYDGDVDYYSTRASNGVAPAFCI